MIYKRIFLVFFLFITPFSLASAEEELTESQAGIVGNAMRNNDENIRRAIESKERQLHTCKETCLGNCLGAIETDCKNQYQRENDDGTYYLRGYDTCLGRQRDCTREKCEATECAGKKRELDEARQQVQSAEEAQDELNRIGEEAEAESDSALRHVEKKQKEHLLYGALGLVATMGLSATATAICNSCPGICAGFGGGCGWCWKKCAALATATGLAGYQTNHLYNQASNIGVTAKDLRYKICERDPPPAFCNTPDGEDKNDLGPSLSPDPCMTDPVLCRIVTGDGSGNGNGYGTGEGGHENPVTCLPGDPNCSPPPAPGGGDVRQRIINHLNTKVKGGLPDGVKKGLGYDDLTKKQKAYLDSVMKPINDKNSAFLKEHLDEEEEEEEEGEIKESGLGYNGKGDSFGSPSSKTQSSSSGSKAKALPLKSHGGISAQMQEMLKNFQLGGKKQEKMDLSEKSVQVGSDVVGVVEDNIFMMVHRRHRSLAGEKRFIANPF